MPEISENTRSQASSAVKQGFGLETRVFSGLFHDVLMDIHQAGYRLPTFEESVEMKLDLARHNNEELLKTDVITDAVIALPHGYDKIKFVPAAGLFTASSCWKLQPRGYLRLDDACRYGSMDVYSGLKDSEVSLCSPELADFIKESRFMTHSVMAKLIPNERIRQEYLQLLSQTKRPRSYNVGVTRCTVPGFDLNGIRLGVDPHAKAYACMISGASGKVSYVADMSTKKTTVAVKNRR